MRQIKRIHIIIEILKNKTNKLKVLNYLFKPAIGTQLKIDDAYIYIDDILDNWENNYEEFSKLWIENPDLRLTQVLITTGILSNFPGLWYYLDNDIIIISANILEPRDIYFWGQIYDKNLNKLPQTNWILIKDMSTDHIKAVLNDCKNNEHLNRIVEDKYLKHFNNELKLKANKELNYSYYYSN